MAALDDNRQFLRDNVSDPQVLAAGLARIDQVEAGLSPQEVSVNDPGALAGGGDAIVDEAVARIVSRVLDGSIRSIRQVHQEMSALLETAFGRRSTIRELNRGLVEVGQAIPDILEGGQLPRTFEEAQAATTEPPNVVGAGTSGIVDIPTAQPTDAQGNPVEGAFTGPTITDPGIAGQLSNEELAADRRARLEIQDPLGTFRRANQARFPNVGGLGRQALENSFSRALSSFELTRTNEDQIFRDFLRGSDDDQRGNLLSRGGISQALAALAAQDPSQLTEFADAKRDRFTDPGFSGTEGDDRTFAAALAGLLSTVGRRFRPSVQRAAIRERDRLFEQGLLEGGNTSLLDQLGQQGGALFRRRTGSGFVAPTLAGFQER